MLALRRGVSGPTLFLLLCCVCAGVHGQAYPVATRKVDVSIFGGVTGVYTGLSAGKNAAVTAGVDLNLPALYGLRPSLEVRGTVPYDGGSVDAQRDILGGLKVERRFGRIYPYIDFLGGRGSLKFVRPYTNSQGIFIYRQPDTTVISPGLGVRVDVGGNFAVFGDGQFQYWDTPASLSGHLFAKPFTAGVSYRFKDSYHDLQH